MQLKNNSSNQKQETYFTCIEQQDYEHGTQHIIISADHLPCNIQLSSIEHIQVYEGVQTKLQSTVK